MRVLLPSLTTLLLFACTPTPYQWQDQLNQGREGHSRDLYECRDYAAHQYQPGMPAGVPYLAGEDGYPHGYDPFGTVNDVGPDKQEIWHDDRNPTRQININKQGFYDLDTVYTGYPGELDYHPGYTAAILEKCMRDRGWSYLPVSREIGRSKDR